MDAPAKRAARDDLKEQKEAEQADAQEREVRRRERRQPRHALRVRCALRRDREVCAASVEVRAEDPSGDRRRAEREVVGAEGELAHLPGVAPALAERGGRERAVEDVKREQQDHDRRSVQLEGRLRPDPREEGDGEEEESEELAKAHKGAGSGRWHAGGGGAIEQQQCRLRRDQQHQHGRGDHLQLDGSGQVLQLLAERQARAKGGEALCGGVRKVLQLRFLLSLDLGLLCGYGELEPTLERSVGRDERRRRRRPRAKRRLEGWRQAGSTQQRSHFERCLGRPLA